VTRHPDPSRPVLSARRCKIVQVIEDSVHDTGYAPSLREIGDAVGLASSSSVAHQLKVLERMGYLTREAGRPRSIALRIPDQRGAAPGTDAGPGTDELAQRRLARVPLVGRIAAGVPRTVYQDVEDVIPLPKQLVGEGSFIMLRVVGESMIDAAITDGDLVVVRRESDVENGDIVAAMIESDTSSDREATVKTFKRVDGHVWLIPHNPAFQPLLADDVEIIGKVVTVLRRL
jgi:repressor LexA